MIALEHQQKLDDQLPEIIDEFSAILKEKYRIEGFELHGLTFRYGDEDGGHCTKKGCGPSGLTSLDD